MREASGRELLEVQDAVDGALQVFRGVSSCGLSLEKLAWSRRAAGTCAAWWGAAVPPSRAPGYRCPARCPAAGRRSRPSASAGTARPPLHRQLHGQRPAGGPRPLWWARAELPPGLCPRRPATAPRSPDTGGLHSLAVGLAEGRAGASAGAGGGGLRSAPARRRGGWSTVPFIWPGAGVAVGAGGGSAALREVGAAKAFWCTGSKAVLWTTLLSPASCLILSRPDAAPGLVVLMGGGFGRAWDRP